jgi:hypothetical protein
VHEEPAFVELLEAPEYVGMLELTRRLCNDMLFQLLLVSLHQNLQLTTLPTVSFKVFVTVEYADGGFTEVENGVHDSLTNVPVLFVSKM